MSEFDIQPKELDKLPVKPLKDTIPQQLGEAERKTSPDIQYSQQDVANALKAFLRKQLLVLIGQEKPTVFSWVTIVVTILGIIALAIASIFPKLNLL